MRIEAVSVSKGANGIPLPETSVLYETGSVTVVEAETGDQPTVAALILSGRMVPDTGTITIDGRDDPAALRERIALVDAPEVSEPAADLPLTTVVREELLYAGRSTSRATVAAAIADAGGSAFATSRIADVPAAVRVRILAELASFRPGVQGLVITSPDRHGGDPRDWLAVARELAARDFAVAIVCGAPSAELIHPLLEAGSPDQVPIAPTDGSEAELTIAPAPTPTTPEAEPRP